MKIICFLLSLFISIGVFWSNHLSAQSLSDNYNECIDHFRGGGRDACNEEELVNQDKRLNDLFKSLMKMESEAGKQNLRSAQRTWIKYKEEWQKYLSDLPEDSFVRENTTYSMMIITAIQADNLQSRIDSLNQYR
ncbi:MAG: DUF1311 domain-containing protein [Deltaproteobacteria bacterium]|jgi:uncharacterized protein YecT (DUF1311 family)|nr:DUF1311 domain-containing protein [Deltaproteobacteria bacterium]